MVYRYVGILTVDVVFFRSPGVFHSQDSFPSTFRPRLLETSSGVVTVGVFTAESRRELWARPSTPHLIYVVHAYCCSVIGQHSDNWNLIGRLLYRCSLWSEVSLWKGMNQTKMEGGTERHLPKTDDRLYQICRWVSLRRRDETKNKETSHLNKIFIAYTKKKNRHVDRN